MKKSLLIATLLSATLATSLAFAERDKDGGCEQRGDKMKRHHEGFSGHKNRGELMQREFSADEIRTLAEARLLMKGNDNLKVGQITATDSGYNVAILTQNGSLVEEKAVAKNGMPLEMYQHMKERMEKRQNKAETQTDQ